MTSLNSKLQLAVLNRKKGHNLLEKGFTLVELMIVIVIVGILSSVALPNFLSQTDKAKLTEAKAASKGYLTQYHAASLEGGTNAISAIKGECPVNGKYFEYDCADDASIIAKPLGDSGLTGTITSSVNPSGVITIGSLSA